MSFNTGLSGLNAQSTALSVASNNIANANTTGFKGSRTEFSDVFAVSAFGVGDTAVGSGVLASKVAQQYTQGNLNFTDNTLDMAISGQGFFVLKNDLSSEENLYSRAGAFTVNKNGFVVNGSGQFLQSYPTNEDGTVLSTSLSTTTPINIPKTAGSPNPTTSINLSLNLDSTTEAITAQFNPADNDTFSSSTSLTVYDSLGNSHVGTAYFRKSANNTWETNYAIDGNIVLFDQAATDAELAALGAPAGTAGSSDLKFNAAGQLITNITGIDEPVALASYDPQNGALPITLKFRFNDADVTQFAAPFNVTNLSQDGFTAGRLSGIDISDSGVVRATFTNGQVSTLGKITLVQFNNNGGLRQLGNTNWSETLNSGTPLPGESGNGDFGLIRSGSLENSNVDLTSELVKLITAQRNFQANARTIETTNQLTQTVVNIR